MLRGITLHLLAAAAVSDAEQISIDPFAHHAQHCYKEQREKSRGLPSENGQQPIMPQQEAQTTAR